MAGPWEQYQQTPAAGPWQRYATQGPEPLNADPTQGMSTLDKLLAGTGRGMTSATLAALQGISKLVGADSAGAGLVKQSTLDENKKLDAPLMNTTAGKVGNVIGNMGVAAPTALIPGVNTYTGAALTGAGLGALTTEGGAQERAKAALAGAVGGAAGKGIGDLAGKGAQWLVDSARTVSPKLPMAQAAQDAGFVIPPADVRSNTLTEALGGLGGKLKTAQQASVRNQPMVNEAAAKALGLQPGTQITPDVLQGLRTVAGTDGYAPIRAAGEVATSPAYNKALDSIASQYQGAARSFPGAAKNPVLDMVDGLRVQKFDAGDAIDMIKVLREAADKAYRSGDTGLGKASKEAAQALEEEVGRHLKDAGNDAALSAFREARTQIAKTYSVQKALNQSTGDVSASNLVKQLEKGKPLSDELLTVAQAAQAFPRAFQSLKEAPKAWSPLDFAWGSLGAGMGSPVPAVMAAARPVVRSMLLSGPAQRYALQQGTPGMLSRATAGLLDQELAQNAFPIGFGLLAADAAR